MSQGNASSSSFEVRLSLKGKQKSLTIIAPIAKSHLLNLTREKFDLNADASLKLLCKGKVIANTADINDDTANSNANLAFMERPKGKKALLIMIMLTDAGTVQQIQTQKSDPLIRGFHNEKQQNLTHTHTHPWGPKGQPHKSYRYVKLQECSTQSFGHQSNTSTPHSFAARNYLSKLACDPGMRYIMIERELVVNALGEMDPIDDRLMMKLHRESHGASSLLGYNTNHGLRIDVKLRTNEERGYDFREYSDVMRTLIHELSHNWVGDHGVLFWSNYAQMRVEYLYVHMKLYKQGYLASGKTTVHLAGLEGELKHVLKKVLAMDVVLDGIRDAVVVDVAREAAQHGIPVQVILPSIQDRCRELLENEGKDDDGDDDKIVGITGGAGHRLGGGVDEISVSNTNRTVSAPASMETKKCKRSGIGGCRTSPESQ